MHAHVAEGLRELNETCQFQVIFYNERPKVFRSPVGTPELAFGTDEEKDRVRHFESTGGDSVKLWDPLDVVKTMPKEKREELRDDLLSATLADGKIHELEQVLMEVLSESLDV